ncbi:unnamed protein product [Allacma fusca]|uniref:Uncharacterized protein n=1 Tax=Allacma fusca TaxID=39272 RepID=A0A8J2LF83_9HEXA|nr:unnamed protein product [Allacma fusca]
MFNYTGLTVVPGALPINLEKPDEVFFLVIYDTVVTLGFISFFFFVFKFFVWLITPIFLAVVTGNYHENLYIRGTGTYPNIIRMRPAGNLRMDGSSVTQLTSNVTRAVDGPFSLKNQ